MKSIEYAYHRFNTERFPLPSEAELQELERRIKVDLPDDYREFILQFNGGYFDEPVIVSDSEGCPQEALNLMNGIRASHDEAELGQSQDLNLFDDNDPPKILPIGDTPLGSLIILDVAPGEGRGSIYFKQAFGGFYHLADGIEEFFELLNEPSDDD